MPNPFVFEVDVDMANDPSLTDLLPSPATPTLDSLIRGVESKMPAINVVTQLGCVGAEYDDATTYSETTGEDNVNRINDFIAGGWVRYGSPKLYFPSMIAVNGTIDTQAQEGLAFIANGGTGWARTIQEWNTGIGGPIGGIFNVADGYTGPLIDYRTQEMILSGFNIYGWYSPNSASDVQNAGSHRAAMGIRIQGQQSGIGVGKLICPDSHSFVSCIKGLYTSASPVEDNADQFQFLGRLKALFCDEGIHQENEQTVAGYINHFDAIHCINPLHISRGGKLTVGILDLQTNNNTGLIGLLIDGDDTVVAPSWINIGHLNVDNTFHDSDAAGLAVSITAANTAKINIGFLDASYDRSHAISPNPLFNISSTFYGALNIYGGTFIYERMIKTTAGTLSFHPTVRLRDVEMLNNSGTLHDPANIFTTDSDNYVKYLQSGNTVRSTAGGTIYAATENTLNL